MKINAARQFILKNARPIDLAVYKYFFENGSNQRVIDELSKFQNEDGGFGNGLEPDFLNPNSSPIATNDAIITLYRTDALECDSDIVKGIVRYLKSHDSFDEDKSAGCLQLIVTKTIHTQYGGKRKMTELAALILQFL